MSSDPEGVLRALRPWDVIYPFDDRAHPHKHKMWVCVARQELWFLRINTLRYTGACVPLAGSDHPFLTHDSFLGCGGHLITAAEVELEHLLHLQADPAKQGIIGSIHASVRQAVCMSLAGSELLTKAQLRIMLGELGRG